MSETQSSWSFGGFMKSFKNYFNIEQLPVENNGTGEIEKTELTEEKKSLWKQLSQFIGKDITSMISLPVWVFEPFSFLQILCEPLQYHDLLEKASISTDSEIRMAYLMAWIIASYSCATRTKKPFNPILGETFEFIEPNNKFKFFAEQVSHHPPIGVAQITSSNYILELEMELKTKFTGNSTEVTVLGSNRFTTLKYNDFFTFGHLDTCAHNIIIGYMWVDHFGILEIKNHNNEDKGILKLTKSGWLGTGRFETTGEIYDKNGNLKVKLFGLWNSFVNAKKINHDSSEGEIIELWKKNEILSSSKWGWTEFNDILNFFDENYKSILPESDSRLRGDRLALEKGDLNLAGKEKQRLEEKQRAERKLREKKSEQWVPKYFKKIPDEFYGHRWIYFGSYWEEREERIKNYQDKNQSSKKEITENQLHPINNKELLHATNN